jgi:hypothetical protein
METKTASTKAIFIVERVVVRFKLKLQAGKGISVDEQYSCAVDSGDYLNGTVGSLSLELTGMCRMFFTVVASKNRHEF